MSRWQAFAESPEYQALPQEEKRHARRKFFIETVAPEIPKPERAAAWNEFLEFTKPDIFDPRATKGPIPTLEASREVVSEMGGVERGVAALGGGMMNIVNGVRQKLGQVTPEEVDIERARQQALDESGGTVGKYVGQAVPFMAIPAGRINGAVGGLGIGAGAVTGSPALVAAGRAVAASPIADLALTGAAMGGLEPTGTGESSWENAFRGALGATTLGLAGKAVGGLIQAAKPFTKSGQEKMVARQIMESADNPEAALAAAMASREIVPGSAPTLAQATQDAGIGRFARGAAQSNQELGTKMVVRRQEQDAARRMVMDDLAKTPEEVATIRELRDDTALPLLEQAKASGMELDVKAMDDYLAGVINQSRRPQVRAALQSVRDELIDANGNLRGDFESLYDIRKYIGDLLEGRVDSQKAAAKAASSELIAARNLLDDSLKQVPGFDQYRQTWASASREADGLEKLQELRGQASVANINPKTEQPFLSFASLAKSLEKPDYVKQLRKSGINENQIGTLRTVVRDFQRGQTEEAAKAIKSSSDTAQNLTVAQAMGTLFWRGAPDTALGRTFAGLANKLYSVPEAQMREIMADALMDPAFAAALMQKASPKAVARAEKLLTRRIAGYTKELGKKTATSAAIGLGRPALADDQPE